MRTTFGVGELTIHRIVEMERGFIPIMEFLPTLTPEVLEEHRSWLEPDGLEPDTGFIKLCYQTYIVRTPHHTVLIDSCIGNDKPRGRPSWHYKRDAAYMTALAAAGIGVEQIDYVMCSHLHADHVGWNTRLDNGRYVPTFPNARYLFSQREYDFWAAKNAAKPIDYMTDSVLPIVAAKRVDFVTSDHALNDHFRLMPTPGHTIDHYAVAVGRGRDAAVLTGDLLHSPLQARYPEMSMRVDHDPKQSAATRRGFLERYCDTDTLCCTAHFPSPSVGHIKRWADGFRCEPVSA